MIYVLVIAIELIIFLVLIVFILYFLSMVISDFFGVPFVPTRQKSLERIFNQVKVTSSDIFYDLGCGDGRTVFFVNERFKAKSFGVELNPLLNWFSRAKAYFQKTTETEFIKKSFFDVDLKKATVIYLFLFPEVVEKLQPKLRKECRPGTLIISHGFKLKWLEGQKFAELNDKPFATHYYRL